MLRRAPIALVLSVLAWLALAVAARPAAAQPLTVAAASDLQGVLPEVARRFEAQSGIVTRVTLGSSGNFFAQIQNGAPFDVFLSADIDYPRRLAASGLGAPDTLYRYATGQVVLWALAANQPLLHQGLRGLTAPAVRRIAIANPEHAPYGRAAVAALQAAGVYDQVRGKLVLGENISQAAQFVQSGNADVGIIARSISLIPAVAARGTGTAILEPYPPIDQAAIVVSASTQGAAARRFMDFLKSPAIVDLLRQSGFAVASPGAP